MEKRQTTRRPRVLMLLSSNCFDPDPRVYAEARALVEHGYRVLILAWDRDRKRPAKETIDGIDVERIYLRSTHGRGPTQAFYLLVVLAIFVCKGLFREFDVVHAHDFDALVIGDDSEFTAFRNKIAELAISNKVPTIHGLREMVDAGGLMAYGASFHDLYRRAASQVKKILQGVKPGDLPIEQPAKFEFVVNVRTARALGLKLSPMLLARADEVIE